MKKYLVIGNPIEHSLSPTLHNYWIKKNNIDAIYEKKKVNKEDIKDIILQVRKGEIDGVNITIPFKNCVIPFLDQLSPLAAETQSVNTVYKKDNKIIGHNTDIGGFELALKHIGYEVKNKRILILGAGGVVSSLIVALKKMKASKIILSNRTKEKAENLKRKISGLEVVNWGEIIDFDMIINATSLGLKKEDQIKIDFSNLTTNKFFYDIIYNPAETVFLSKAKASGNKTENGKIMFIYQAHEAFAIWHKILPIINNEIIKLLDQ
jgi:shikimate dehydrogenase